MFRRPKPRQAKALWFTAKYGNAPQKNARRRIPAMSKSMSVLRTAEAKLKREFLARPENKWCPVSLKIRGRRVRTRDHHHTRGKAFPALRLAVAYWLAVSRWGHDWIEQNKEKAREFGWLCAKGEWNTLPQ